MTRRNADDEYEYPLLAEEIISYKVVRAQIIQHGLKRFEFDIYQELVIRLWKARRKGKDLNAFFGFKVLRSVLNDKHAEIKRERKVRDKHRRKSLQSNSP